MVKYNIPANIRTVMMVTIYMDTFRKPHKPNKYITIIIDIIHIGIIISIRFLKTPANNIGPVTKTANITI